MPRPGRMKRANSRYKEQAECLAVRLREIREEHSLSQEKLAARAGVSVATIRKIEKGTVVEPGFFTVLSITEALGVTADDLAIPPPSAVSTENAGPALLAPAPVSIPLPPGARRAVPAVLTETVRADGFPAEHRRARAPVTPGTLPDLTAAHRNHPRLHLGWLPCPVLLPG